MQNSILDNFYKHGVMDANVNDEYGKRFFPHPIKISKIVDFNW